MFLELKNTDIGYQTPLIEGVETSLELGEVCLLIGNNGVGKTTLIKSILNQIPVLHGEILINKKNIKNLSTKEIAQQIAVVFSKSQIPANYTLQDLVSLGKFIHYPYYFELNNSDKQEVEEIIESLYLSEYKNLPLSKLSDGNLQKAFIGRALAQNSSFIILDEPTTHLDEENKIMILKLLRNLAKKHNKLILFSSHDWRLAKEFADKIWLINHQKLESGLSEDVLLQNSNLTNPQLFTLNPVFVSPEIIAPTLHKEILYSALQKNIEKDISRYKITFNDTFWEISGDNIHEKCFSIEEIIIFINKDY